MENIFLQGNFAVMESEKRKSFFLSEESETLSLDNWVEKGYPFYPGNITLISEAHLESMANTKIFLEVGSFEAVGCKVEVNGHPAGIIGWDGESLLVSPYL